ncbi:hypothetical protein [Bartonella sp. CB178]|uniref:hypothetical protein n=1 Tax=Bartonella sp. CB178 TaxID=3112255 RepID=UPI00300E6793
MRGVVVDQNQGFYFVSGGGSERRQILIVDWLGKIFLDISGAVDFLCNGYIISSVFLLLQRQPKPPAGGRCCLYSFVFFICSAFFFYGR